MPCRHGPRPTAWWRPTAPCSISMCGRCCGASTPRSTQASSGSRRNRCLTCPSWRRPKTSSTNTKTRHPKQGFRRGKPFLPLRSSRLRRRKGRRSPRRTGKVRLALRNLRSLHKCGLQSQPQAQPSPRQPQPPPQQWPPQQRGAPPPPSRTPPQPPPMPRPSQVVPPREAKALTGPQPPQTKPALAPRGSSLEDKPAKKRRPWKAIIKWGVVTLVILGIAAGLWIWLAQPNLLGSGKAPGQPGAKSTNKGAPNDPNDPRSRKTDRLPGPS